MHCFHHNTPYTKVKNHKLEKILIKRSGNYFSFILCSVRVLHKCGDIMCRTMIMHIAHYVIKDCTSTIYRMAILYQISEMGVYFGGQYLE